MTTHALLTRHGREVSSVFDLLGRDENDLTAAFGFALARSPGLLHRIVQRVAPGVGGEGVVLRLEERDTSGRADLEISVGDYLIVVEAKRGWLVPGETQLAKYAPRIAAQGSGVLVSLSAASSIWARQTLPEAVQGVPVAHLPWDQVRQDLADARRAARGQERAWLEEFSEYLRKAIRMRDPADSWTYCANFLAFRWDGQVQQVCRVIRAEVIPDLQSRWLGIPQTSETIRPHALYHLGPPLPGTPVPSGTTYRAARVWVILDHLLTSPTLKDARIRTASVTGQPADPQQPTDSETP